MAVNTTVAGPQSQVPSIVRFVSNLTSFGAAAADDDAAAAVDDDAADDEDAADAAAGF